MQSELQGEERECEREPRGERAKLQEERESRQQKGEGICGSGKHAYNTKLKK